MSRILIIDDDPAVGAAIRGYLELDGFSVVTASSGRAGIETLAASDFDLVIIDLFLPDIDGLSIITTIRQQAPGVPLIAVSGMMPAGLVKPGPLGTVRILWKPLAEPT